MKRTVHLLIGILMLFAGTAHAQQALNPADPIVVYNSASPPTAPAFGRIGKWVKTTRMGWNTSDFKCYIYKGLNFRLKFPKTYQHNVADGKKYPIFVFLHGRGEGGTVYDNEYQLLHGGQNFETQTDNGNFDGFLFYGQTADGNWGNGQFDIIKELLDSLSIQVKGDLNRVIVNGLSAGGYGSWAFSERYPQYFAAVMPMSGIANGDATTDNINKLKFTSLWYFQGGLDNAPAPYTANTVVTAYQNAGADLKYTLYPNLGHGTWNTAWAEPDFVPFMNRANALNPWPLTGRSEFCPGETFSLVIGIPPGFSAYEWQKDGNTIPNATGNSITVNSLGTYAVRVKRTANGAWSEFSPTPLVIKTKTATVTPPISIDSLATNILPAPDGSTTVTLQLPAGYASYEWRTVGGTTSLGNTNTLTVGVGQYIARVTEQFGCASSFSSPYKVIAAAGTNLPDAVGGATVTSVSQTQLTLNWTDKANPQNNETGFEIYRTTTPGNNYKLVGKVAADILAFNDNGLASNTKYYYVIRPVNANGAGPVSTEASGTTQTDGVKPTAPQNLLVTNTTTSSVSLSWTAATDDVGIAGYDIYVNNAKAYSVDGTQLTMVTYGLTDRKVYNFYVVAKDAAGNLSAPSNQVTAATVNKGLAYKYYEGTYSTLPNFNNLTPLETGRSANTDITVRNRETNYAIMWTGFITIPVSGTYYFGTNSDDGSKLWVNIPYSYSGTSTVNNDGAHGTTQVSSAAINLNAGVYPITAAYFQGTGGQAMNIRWRSTALNINSLTNIPDQYLGDTLTMPGNAPTAPVIFGATAPAFNKVNLSWTDNSNNETGFELYRSATATGTYSVIGKTNANATSLVDNTVAANTRYYYKVRAIGQFGESAQSTGYPWLAVYPFNNAVSDISINANNGTANAMTYTTTDEIEGTHAAVFNGTSAYVTIGGSSSGFLHDAFSGRTVSMWIKPTVTDNNRILLDMGGSDNGLALRINANKLEAGIANNSVRTLISTAFTSTNWTHVALVFSGSGSTGVLRMYLNGDLAGTLNTNYSSVGTTTNNSRLGSNNGTNAFNSTGTFYRGNMDNVAIIGQALTQAEISQLAAQNLPFYSVVTPTLPAAPAAPSNVAANAASPSSIILSWTNTNNDVNTKGFDIQRSFGTSNTFVTVKSLDTVVAGTNNYTDTALYANQQYVYRVRAKGDGGTSAYSSNATATTGNNRPVIQDIANQSARYDVETRIPVVATDPDEDAITLSGANLPSFVTLASDAQGSFLKVTPNVGLQGSYPNLAVIATDAFGGKDTVTFNLTINDNYSPIITSIANVSLNEGDVQQLSLAAADQNASDALTWSGVSLPSFISISGNNRSATLNINPGYADAGVYNVKVAIVDGNGGTDNKTFTVTIADKDPNYKFFVRFKHQTDAPAPWNNITTVSTSNLKNDKGETTNVGLQLLTGNWYSWNEGAVTGNNSGVYPDVVLREYYFFGSYPGIFNSDNSINGKLTGLDATRKYSFKFFAGSSWSVQANNGTTIFTMNGVSKPIDVQGNTTVTANFDNIAPNAQGEINFNMAVANGTQVGYLGAIEVNAILDDGTVPAAPKDLTAAEANGNVSLSWTNIAYNATGYRVHRATDSLGTYSLLGSLNSATANAYVDSTVHGNTHYYYKISASNSAGVSTGYSNIAGVNVPVKPPHINDIADIKLKADASAQFNVQAQGDLGNTVTLTVSGLPAFGNFTDNGNGAGTFSFNPTANNLGSYAVTLTATDNQGAASSSTFNVLVSDKNTKSIYFNFSSSNPAATPWNNVAGFPYAGTRFTNALDESGFATGINMTFVENWENDATAAGMSTYDNSGIYPDNVMRSAVYDSRNITHTVRLSGLNNAKRYNVVFFSSLNFGVAAKARFTIGTDSVVIDPSYNTSLTKQINGVTPNANGEINILVNKTQAGYYMYMNTLVLEEYDALQTPVVNPLNLRAGATGAKSIKLDWADRANNETGYQVWRAISGGSYSLVTTLAANTVTYTDNNLSVNQKYYYKVRATSLLGNSDYSNAAAATTPGFSVQVNFSELLVAPAPWNNTGMRPQSGTVISNMKDGQSNTTGIGITILENFDGMYSAGVNTGNNSGVYPDNVMVENYGLFPGNHADFNITGLNQTLKYDLVFFGSSTEWEDITGKYTVNGTRMALLNASMNKSGVVTIRDISPDANGKIHIDVDPGTATSRYGLIAALTIRGHIDPATQNEDGPVDPQELGARLTLGDNTVAVSAPAVALINKTADFGDTKVYPNPFDNQFNVDIVLKAETAVRIEIFDMAGRLMYSDYKGSVPAGNSTLRINTGSRISAPGLYLLRISGKNGETKMVKLVKH
ncbi:fibronectin type III domain-containing protein [Chitinophaga pinensis]|uniref:PA14 domain protein n=1 Tax=Chitinophaga pinensis (strain ATCC 43595 / DSM 2588 / LMG 13176 / NBRC 15968 / NCIMB 11800 / UQM 2034) TaxID=485918 RepID=A0A979G5M5_CHIPD|nr:fibronectin type III domain-containing protein [Chitinophaga pinensis]ACU61166.1 PA14 domain protein [Chitinophaga pinensis DSM 2588]